MKVNKMITIDIEVLEKLKEFSDNHSGLINKLLKEHMEIQDEKMKFRENKESEKILEEMEDKIKHQDFMIQHKKDMKELGNKIKAEIDETR
jgi:methionyl-tRNA formyltransferase